MFLFFFENEELDFTEAQKKKVRELIESGKDVIEIALCESGITLAITDNEKRKKIVPQGDMSNAFTLKDKRNTYFVSREGNILGIGYGAKRYGNEIKIIKRSKEE